MNSRSVCQNGGFMQNISSAKDDMNRQILSATESLIAEIGIQNLSMRKIATQAGIALGTLYLYFKTKDDLLKEPLTMKILFGISLSEKGSKQVLLQNYQLSYFIFWVLAL